MIIIVPNTVQGIKKFISDVLIDVLKTNKINAPTLLKIVIKPPDVASVVGYVNSTPNS